MGLVVWAALLGGLPGGLPGGLGPLVGSPRVAFADEAIEQAKKRYEVGEREFLSGRYWQAAKAFEEAFDLSKRGDLLFNAAKAYDRGDYYVRAIEAYSAYLGSTDTPPDRASIEKRIVELRDKTATLLIRVNQNAFVYVDGHEYGKTPMREPILIDSGYHRIDVRDGNKVWFREQQVSAGQKYEFDAVLEQTQAGDAGQGLVTVEERKPKRTTKRFAAVLGAGAALDIAGNNFPPHQAQLALGLEYRALEGPFGALDFALRVPFDVAQGWINSGFLVGVRGALTPSPRLPLELVLGVDLGLASLNYGKSAPLIAGAQACAVPSQLDTCTLYGVRLHPSVSLAYRVVPAIELRLEVLGADVNFTGPIADPRLTFGAAFAYRF